jgi:hypothetical protein
MFKKQFILFLAGVLLLAGFFMLPHNRKWVDDRIFTYYSEFQTQRNHLDRETRMRRRFGNSYIFSKSIADELKKRGVDRNALVLVPPPDYFIKRGVDYPMPEPSVFYYYTGIKTTWCHFVNAMNANWYVRLDSGKVVVDNVIDKKSLQDTINSFLKWKKPYE